MFIVFALSDLSQAQPALLKKSFPDIFILMGKIIERKNLDEESIRGIAYEILIFYSIINYFIKYICWPQHGIIVLSQNKILKDVD